MTACSVYVVVEEEGDQRFLKIGIAGDIRKRWPTYKRTDNPRRFRVVGFVEFGSRRFARRVEAILHYYYRHWRVAGEWFGRSVENIEAMAEHVIAHARDYALESTNVDLWPEHLVGPAEQDRFQPWAHHG